MKNRKADLVVWIFVCTTFLVLLIAFLLTSKGGELVQVRVSGKVVATYSMEQDGEYTIEGKNDGQNIVVIKNKKVYMKKADCPDKVCVNQGKISKVGQSIICLPHQVVVEILEKKDISSGVDAVAN